MCFILFSFSFSCRWDVIFANSFITFTHISFRDETLAKGFEISVLLFGYTLNTGV